MLGHRFPTLAGAVDRMRTLSEAVEIRYRRAAWTSLAVLSGRVLNILTAFLTIPLLSRYLGGEMFGLWMLVTNFISFLIFADLGVGVGFQNQLIRCYAGQNRKDPSGWLANAIVIMITMAVAIVITAVLVVPKLPLSELVAAESLEARQWIAPAFLAVACSFAVGLPAMLLEYIGNAYQRGYWTHSLTAIGRFLSLILVCFGCYLQSSIVVLIVLYVAVPHVVGLAGLVVLCWKLDWMRPDLRAVSLDKIRRLLHVGFGMLGIRITHAVATQGPVWLIAHFHGLAIAGMIAVVQKLLLLPTMATQPVLIAMQGALGEAAHRGQWHWVKQNLSRLMVVTLAVFGTTTVFALTLGGETIVWLMDRAVPPPSRELLVLLCLYAGMANIRFGFGTFLTTMDRVYSQAAYRFAFLTLAIALVYANQMETTMILLSFVVLAEFPQLSCTIVEAFWFIRHRQRTESSCVKETLSARKAGHAWSRPLAAKSAPPMQRGVDR